MRSRTLVLPTLALAAAGFISPVQAADLLPPPPVLEAPPVAVEIGTGWYLRGDIGYVAYSRPKDADASPSLPVLRDIDIGESLSVGGGVGYRFTPWLRADVTADYRIGSKFSDWSSGSYDQFGQAGMRGFNVERGRFDQTLILANAYIDLGTWAGITPYVGAGVGTAERSFRDFYTETTCLVAGCLPGAAAGPQGRIERADRSKWDLAWALMGGFSADLGHGFSLDLGYRYVHLGTAETGYDIGIVDGSRTRLKNIDSHEARIGLRYMFAGTGFGTEKAPAGYTAPLKGY